jgi:hypothetical protein
MDLRGLTELGASMTKGLRVAFIISLWASACFVAEGRSIDHRRVAWCDAFYMVKPTGLSCTPGKIHRILFRLCIYDNPNAV